MLPAAAAPTLAPAAPRGGAAHRGAGVVRGVGGGGGVGPAHFDAASALSSNLVPSSFLS